MGRAVACWLAAGLGLGGCTHYYPVPTTPVFPAAPAATPAPQDCRKFTRTITIDGKDVEAIGYVCQQPDGTWRLVP